jgi:HEAT repeat protein
MLEALSAIAGPEAGPAAARELLSERPDVRAAAARLVGRVRYEPASRWLDALRSDYVAEVRRSAVEALAKLPAERSGAR